MKKPTLLIAILALISVLDFAQPIFMEWRPKFAGAIAGGFLYAAVALALYRGLYTVAWISALIPIIPITTLVLFAFGVSLPVQPDFAMKAILVLQIVASVLSWTVIRRM